MRDMKKLAEKTKFPSRTEASILKRFRKRVAELQGEEGEDSQWLFCDRQISSEAIITALVLHFLDLSEAKQAEILRRRVPEFEELLGFSSTMGGKVEKTPSGELKAAGPGKVLPENKLLEGNPHGTNKPAKRNGRPRRIE